MTTPRQPRVLDAVCAAAAGAAALALYVATLQPDLGGPEDTPKFQFVGYVLGTPHPPGYPLYIVLSHLFVQLPLGTIAYRANLFSAVMAALACAMVFLVSRQIGAPRWAAGCAALAMATGASYWRSAVFAEVYGLAAVMAVATTLLLLAWGRRGGLARLLAAVAAFGLGLGNHLTLVGVLPAYVAYILWRDRRAVTLRAAGAAAAIMALCAAQYGLIIVRTRQGAPYLESVAASVPDLLHVMTAERYAGQRFAFGPAVLLTDHLPSLASVIGVELGVVGVMLLIIGTIAAVRRRNAGALAILGGAAGMGGMVLNLSGDLKGFITPLMTLLWPVAALGAGELRVMLAGTRERSVMAVTAPIVAIAAALAMPLINLENNYRDSDQSGQTGEARFLRAMYRQLPDRAAVVTEDYFYDMALHYLMLTGEGGPDRDIARVTFDARAVRDAAHGEGRFASATGGRRVFAFAGGATFFATDGLRFERIPVVGPPLEAWLRDLPRGAVVVGATAFVAPPIDLPALGHPDARPPGRPRPFEAFALVMGRAGDAWRAGDVPAALSIESGDSSLRAPLADRVRASADANGARVDVGGHTVARVETGLALAVFGRDGAFSRGLEFRSGGPSNVPYQAALYELKGETSCVEVGGTWTDVSAALRTGSWVATLPAIGSVTIESAFADDPPRQARSADLLGDGIARTMPGDPLADGSAVLVTELRRETEHRPVFRIAFDRVPRRVRARVRPGGAVPTVKICGHQPHALFLDDTGGATLTPDFESEALFGAGWSDAERTATGPVRRAADTATLLLPLPGGWSYQLSLDLAGPAGTRIDFAANGAATGACEMTGAPCVVTLPASVLRDGITTLTLAVHGPTGSTRSPEITLRSGRVSRAR